MVWNRTCWTSNAAQTNGQIEHVMSHRIRHQPFHWVEFLQILSIFYRCSCQLVNGWSRLNHLDTITVMVANHALLWPDATFHIDSFDNLLYSKMFEGPKWRLNDSRCRHILNNESRKQLRPCPAASKYNLVTLMMLTFFPSFKFARKPQIQFVRYVWNEKLKGYTCMEMFKNRSKY